MFLGRKPRVPLSNHRRIRSIDERLATPKSTTISPQVRFLFKSLFHKYICLVDFEVRLN